MIEQYDVAAILGGLYGDGIIGLQGRIHACVRRHAPRQTCSALFEEAWQCRDGAVPRGPSAGTSSSSPSGSDGFVEIVSHPWFVARLRGGARRTDYRIVEIGFDMPLPGAADQPWHRDFPGDTRQYGRGAAELAGVQPDDRRHPAGARPVRDRAGHAVGRHPGRQGDMFPDRIRWDRSSRWRCRSAAARRHFGASGLTIHRGTANRSDERGRC